MMKWRLGAIVSVVALTLLAVTVAERGAIGDALRRNAQPALPEAVSYQEATAAPEPAPAPAEPAVADAPAEDTLPEYSAQDASEAPAADAPAPEPSPSGLPEAINLAVPFTPQAPRADWGMPYQEACEEASLFMVQSYYDGRAAGLIPADEADAEILRIVAFETSFLGFYEDTTVDEVARVAEALYGLSHVEVLRDPTVDALKAQLAAGRPVMVPSAGQQLGNPYFSGAGPRYHMLVLRGYTADGFITNDPGTYRGQAYVYPYEAVMTAMHDWNGGDVENGAKVALVVYP